MAIAGPSMDYSVDAPCVFLKPSSKRNAKLAGSATPCHLYQLFQTVQFQSGWLSLDYSLLSLLHFAVRV